MQIGVQGRDVLSPQNIQLANLAEILGITVSGTQQKGAARTLAFAVHRATCNHSILQLPGLQSTAKRVICSLYGIST